MTSPEETILKRETGFGLKQKGDKKYRFNPPAGTLVLTDRRLIFAQSGGLSRSLFGGVSLTKVKVEETWSLPS